MHAFYNMFHHNTTTDLMKIKATVQAM